MDVDYDPTHRHKKKKIRDNEPVVNETVDKVKKKSKFQQAVEKSKPLFDPSMWIVWCDYCILLFLQIKIFVYGHVVLHKHMLNIC